MSEISNIPWTIPAYHGIEVDGYGGRLSLTIHVSSDGQRVNVTPQARDLAWGGFDGEVAAALAERPEYTEFRRLQTKLADTERDLERLRDDLTKVEIDRRALLRGSESGEKLTRKLATLAGKEGELTGRLAIAEQGVQTLVDAVGEARGNAEREARTAAMQACADRSRRLTERQAALRTLVLAAVEPYIVEVAALEQAQHSLGHASGFADTVAAVLGAMSTVPSAPPPAEQAEGQDHANEPAAEPATA